MSKKYVIGNWKSNKKGEEVKIWFKKFADKVSRSKKNIFKHHKVVVCPAFVYLERASTLVKKYKLPIEIGAQDISPYDDGPYTGEVSASMIKEFSEYVIIGHSERRQYFGEKDKILFEKAKRAKSVGLNVIYCVPDKVALVPPNVSIVAYEPVWAIGTGKAETPENAAEVAREIKEKTGVSQVIYGGSVTEKNIADFIKQKSLSGVLPGGASLDPEHFFKIVKLSAACLKDSNVEHLNTSR